MVKISLQHLFLIVMFLNLIALCVARRQRPVALNTVAGKIRPVRPTESAYKYDTYYYKQQVDHFGFTNMDTFLQRYLVNKDHWTPGGAIFFYTGNEGDITWFCENTGFMWDIAKRYGAMLVFGEHRYYGKSLPYGKLSYKKPEYTNYLTSEQALADYVELLAHIKSSVSGAGKSKVVAFGGSYGGMLSAWLRLKYPDIVVGSLAASAPIWMFPGMNPCGAFSQTVTNTFGHKTSPCVQNIRKSWKIIDDVSATASGKEFISSTFHLCTPLKVMDDVEQLKGWLSGSYVNLAMVDYPYPASFLEPLPGWPVKKVCAPLSGAVYDGKALLAKLHAGVNVYFNFTGKAVCLNTSQDSAMSDEERGWGYQSCTEMMSPSCSDNVNDMFEVSKWNATEFIESCYEDWGVKPRSNWTQIQYGGRNIKYSSNIVFSNGNLDPWSSLGVTTSLSDTLKAVHIDGGAHHLDLRASNVLDPVSVMAAREKETNEISRWLNEKL